MTLEKLLNKLVSLGWKPRGIDNLKEIKYDEYGFVFVQDFEKDGTPFDASLRELVSLESGFRQFVCERVLYKKIDKYNEEEKNIVIDAKEPRQEYEEPILGYECMYEYKKKNHQYWLMLSSIQENLEEFLLSNITLPDGE